MSEPTPRTDAQIMRFADVEQFVRAGFARELERERASKDRQLTELYDKYCALEKLKSVWETAFKEKRLTNPCEKHVYAEVDYYCPICLKDALDAAERTLAAQRTALLALFDEAERNGHQGIAVRGREIISPTGESHG